ncbi:MAG: tetratricopeptide repeat protein [Leptolyngbya sp.]|nr:tetratricopeptide repeat protein [Candidatus Melainabacteria bacterium]
MCPETEIHIESKLEPRLVEVEEVVHQVGTVAPLLDESKTEDKTTVGAQTTVTTAPKIITTPNSDEIDPKYLLIDRECDWPKTRKLQLFNAFYFGLCGIFFVPLALRLKDLAPTICFAACAFLTAVSCLYLAKHRLHSTVNTQLPLWSQESLRALALGLPLTVLSYVTYYYAEVPKGATFVYESAGTYTPAPEVAAPVLTFDQKLVLAQKYYDDDNYTQARPLYQEIVNEDPYHALALENLAECYYHSYMKNSNENALVYANRALAIAPTSPHTVEVKALVLNQMKRFREALPVARLATKLYPNSGRSFEALATSEKALGHYNEALQADNQHVKLHSNEASAIADRIDTLKKLHRNTDADTKALAKLNADAFARH